MLWTLPIQLKSITVTSKLFNNLKQIKVEMPFFLLKSLRITATKGLYSPHQSIPTLNKFFRGRSAPAPLYPCAFRLWQAWFSAHQPRASPSFGRLWIRHTWLVLTLAIVVMLQERANSSYLRLTAWQQGLLFRLRAPCELWLLIFWGEEAVVLRLWWTIS